MNVGMVKDADLELSLRQAINLEWSQLSDAEQSVYRPKQSGCGFMTTGFSDGSFEFIAQVNLEQLRDCAFISPGLLAPARLRRPLLLHPGETQRVSSPPTVEFHISGFWGTSPKYAVPTNPPSPSYTGRV